MLWVIVGIVVVGAVFVFGALLGSSVARNLAGDRARQFEQDRRDAGVRPRVHLTSSLLEG